jgi:hypothetical protein
MSAADLPQLRQAKFYNPNLVIDVRRLPRFGLTEEPMLTAVGVGLAENASEGLALSFDINKRYRKRGAALAQSNLICISTYLLTFHASAKLIKGGAQFASIYQHCLHFTLLPSLPSSNILCLASSSLVEPIRKSHSNTKAILVPDANHTIPYNSLDQRRSSSFSMFE